MKKYTFQQIRDKNLLLYEYIRGSHLYGLNTPESDVDTGGVFLAPFEQLVGLGFDYQDQIASEKNDDVWYEMTKFLQLLLKSNPTMLESLYADKDLIISDIHPIMKEILANRDMFVTQACFKPFGAYAIEQIRKARGLNKKIVNPVTERLQPLDFAYTFYKQGSSKIENWLSYRGLKQQYCGLVHVPNCHDTYGVYYDFGNHVLNEGTTAELLQQVWINNLDKEHSDDISKCDPVYKFMRFAMEYLHCSAHLLWVKLSQIKPIGYKGMVGEDGLSNELRLSSVSKGEAPICHMTYNKDGYTEHCKDYLAYKDWEKNRNPVRYESNLNKSYDCYLNSETEFLTNNGWKKYDEVTDNDLMACFNHNHCIEYKPFISRTDDIYNGQIYTFESSYLRFSITPNHKLYLSPLYRRSYNNFSTKYDKSVADWQLKTVDDYFNKTKKSYYHQLNHLNNDKCDNDEYSDDFIKLLGMFLSEGCLVFNNKSETPTGIRISQLNGRCGCEVMKSISSIKITDYTFDKRGKGIEHTYECNDKDVLTKILQCNGRYSLDKDIPSYVYTFSKRQFDILLNSMLCGDGHKHKKGHSIYYTYSYKMAKSLHTLLMLNNYNSQLYGKNKEYRYNHKSNYKRKDGVINNSYQVFISKNDNQYSVLNKNKVKYNCGWSVKNVVDERIVCFETEYGTLVTRNNEKMSFHGNSKNIMHCMRLFTMCTEIANGEGFNLKRTHDREFLLKIRNHEFEYDEIMEIVETKKKEMDKAIENSTIPREINLDFVNDLLINIRKKQFNINF